jgi:hypothetical protein
MVEALGHVALLWMIFNVVIGAIMFALFAVRAARRRTMVRCSGAGRLMAAHFSRAGKRGAIATKTSPKSNVRPSPSRNIPTTLKRSRKKHPVAMN